MDWVFRRGPAVIMSLTWAKNEKKKYMYMEKLPLVWISLAVCLSIHSSLGYTYVRTYYDVVVVVNVCSVLFCSYELNSAFDGET
jgi:hypothetical protein